MNGTTLTLEAAQAAAEGDRQHKGRLESSIREPEDLKRAALIALRRLLKARFPTASVVKARCRVQIGIIEEALKGVMEPERMTIAGALRTIKDDIGRAVKPSPTDMLKMNEQRFRAAAKLLEFAHAKPKAPTPPKEKKSEANAKAPEMAAAEAIRRHRERMDAHRAANAQ